MSVDGTVHSHHHQTSSKKRRQLNSNKKIETTEDDEVKNDDNNKCEVVEVCDLVELVEKEEISPTTATIDRHGNDNDNDDAVQAEELKKLKKACANLSQENRKLKRRALNTTEGIKGQYEHRIQAEQDARAKLRTEMEEARGKLAMQEEINCALQKEIPTMLLAKMAKKQEEDDAEKAFNLEEEMSALRARIELQIVNSQKMSLLSKVFDLAAEKYKSQVVLYPTYQYSHELLRNECLFGGYSSVAELFFKACPPHVLAQHLFKKEDGSLNT